MNKTVLGWHFVGDTLRDGRPIPPDGEWLEHDGPVEMCYSGLHASRRAIDALYYAPGGTICRVKCEKVKAEDGNKLVCRRRLIVWRRNVNNELRQFARWCAMQVIDLWNSPDVVRQYLETGDETLRNAASAAASAASDAACAAQDSKLMRLFTASAEETE